jgi:hypothetical protein
MKTYLNLSAMIVALILLFTPFHATAGTLVIPAWSFARGNARIYAAPAHYADAGPVVGSGPEEPWGWTVEYDIDIPVTAYYTLQICYASAEPRPIEVRLDSRGLGTACNGVTFSPATSDTPDMPSGNSSCAKWDSVARWGAVTKIWDKEPLIRGKHTLKLSRRQPLPHLVALRFDTETSFPEDWQPPHYAVHDFDSIPAAQRKVFLSSKGVKPDLPPALAFTQSRPGGTLDIPAWTFDRGNARVYASPDKYAIGGPLAGDGAQPDEEGVVEYDIDFPVDGEYSLYIRYAAVELRPVDVYLDGRKLGKTCTGLSLNTAGLVKPHEYTVSSRSTTTEALYEKGKLLKVPVSAGKHTVKLARLGPLPHLVSLRFETASAFPKDWKQPERPVDLRRVPSAHRAAFLPPESVNAAALRLAVEETIIKYGPRYSKGPRYLKNLFDLEVKQKAAENGTGAQKQEVSDALTALRSKIMMGHPLLNFDKLLFIKRPWQGYGHTYSDQHSREVGGNLCVLSPVSPDGTVSPLVPELEGGLFDRFDLSYDAKKVIFSYRRSNETFRIYEIDIDPEAGKMVPGSLRQLTFGGEEEAKALRCQAGGGNRRFDDMDPCYLPNGKIMFASTRAQRIVFCSPGAAVTTLHVMDPDGSNMRRLSESPVSETSPSVLPDGRVIYTRWEYVDKGLAHAQSLWSMHPDGSSVDHVYKNNTTWPAGMSSARAIPGSRQIVTIGGNHHFTAVGPVILVDPRISRSSPAAMTCITPETGYPPRYGYPADGNTFGSFMDPYPLSEDFFLVSHVLGVPPGQQRKPYALYLLDAWGNRAELLMDPDISCFLPMPLRPRRKPMDLAVVRPKIKPGDTAKMTSLFIQDVYKGMTGIERGKVKYIRVMGALEWPWDEVGISWNLGVYDPHRKKVYGIANVHEDGSAHFKVPADENLFFQALDENYMALQEMASFINMMPGEKRSCIGCHENRSMAPVHVSGRPMAMDPPVQDLVPQPGDTGPRMVDFTADIQPILDKHCISCHNGRSPDSRLNLINAPKGKYSRSYDNLVGSGFICYRGGGKAGIQSVPPLTHGSRASKLPVMLKKGHHTVKLSREEMIRLVTWIDANVPYYGTYRGNRNIEDKDHPNYRALPVVVK